MTITFDLHTVFVICSSLSLALGLCMLLVHFTGRLYPGFRYWLVGVIGQGLAFTLFAYSQNLPILASGVLGNVLYTFYPTFYSRGFRAFAGRSSPALPLVAAFIYQTAVSYYFTAVHPSANLRVTAMQLVIMPYYYDCIQVVLTDPAFRFGQVRKWIAGTFVLMILIGLVRISLSFAIEANRQVMWAPSTIQAFYLTTLTALSISIAIAVIVLNFHRAAKELEDKEQLLIADVAARTAAEAALRESEAKYRMLVERSPESVIVHRDGTVIYANPSAGTMFGVRSTDDLIGRDFNDFVHPDHHPEVYSRRRHASKLGTSNPLIEMRFLKADGTPFEVETQSVKILFDGAPAFQITAHDTSELKRAAAEQREFQRNLQETQKLESLGVLAGGIAHDFNNILTGIMGNASLASLDIPGDSPAAENIQAITEGAKRAADLCRQMLAYSGKGNFIVQNLSLSRLVEETGHLLRISISKNADLRFHLQERLPPIRADATQIRQVIMNLVINASEAIGDGHGEIRLSTGVMEVNAADWGHAEVIPLQEPASGPYVYLEVNDTGCGMSAATQGKIFEPFFTTKFAGRGLGLAAVLGIVRGHKGILKITSDIGRGTTFKLLFPRVEGAIESVEGPVLDNHGWRGRGRVLVVDDEEAVRTTAASMLRRLGFDVTLASDGAEAVMLFQAAPQSYRLVLMDLTMPQLDGKEAFHQMRTVRNDILLILMSGFDAKEAVSRFAEREAAGFVAKPFAFEDLGAVLRSVLETNP